MKKSHKFLVVLIIVCLIWFVRELYLSRSVDVSLLTTENAPFKLSMPLKDKQELEYFFRQMMAIDEGGYTLLGNKPITVGVYRKIFSCWHWTSLLSSLWPPNVRQYCAWKTWEKYQSYFPIKNFEFWEENNCFWKGKGSAVLIVFVNKKKFEEIVDRYQDDFTFVMQKRVTAAELLQQAKTSTLFGALFRCHDGLIGTVLGYGRDNAWLFKAQGDGNDVSLEGVWGEELNEFYQNQLSRGWCWFGQFPDSLEQSVGYPCFAADRNSAESIRLRQDYLDTRQRIIDYYTGKDFLEATLSLLIQKNQDSHDRSI